jgi:alkanesulfonate monooxygenase SsuD/methylene tetrahydromethanopterin reductase-like flavin-dependent oxidoreductase (luciferase family)
LFYLITYSCLISNAFLSNRRQIRSTLYNGSLLDVIPVYVSGLGEQSAKLAGEEADGFVTNELDIETIKNKLFPALEKGTRISGKDYVSVDKILFIPTSYSEDKERAVQSIRFWRSAMIKAFFDVDVHDPRKIEENGPSQ